MLTDVQLQQIIQDAIRAAAPAAPVKNYTAAPPKYDGDMSKY